MYRVNKGSASLVHKELPQTYKKTMIRHFTEGKIQMVNAYMKRCLTTVII